MVEPAAYGPTHGRVASTAIDAGKETVSVKRPGENLPARFFATRPGCGVYEPDPRTAAA
jgi:hypothetical protein